MCCKKLLRILSTGLFSPLRQHRGSQGWGRGLLWRCAICATSPLLESCEKQGLPRRCNWHLFHSLLHNLSFCETHGQATMTKLITTFTPTHGFFEPSQDTPQDTHQPHPGHVMIWGVLHRNTPQRSFLGQLRCLCHVPEAETRLSLCFMCSNYSPRVPSKLLEIVIITELLHDALENWAWMSQLWRSIQLPSSWKMEIEGTSGVVVILRWSLWPKKPSCLRVKPKPLSSSWSTNCWHSILKVCWEIQNLTFKGKFYLQYHKLNLT